MKIVTRQEAKALKLKRYYTGEPCHRGHYDERTLASGECITCHRIRIQGMRRKRKEVMSFLTAGTTLGVMPKKEAA
ncbi:hypothetical protein [Parendozoicomonas haliclonae]|uniref:Uncharacterized protein n=1 Tax=Parendozoicomonas haliclonae TaxID=1960125 RepID=A0A1X7AEI9_9GAMM|nr:hypothetical protein [Parendozoicomonas haliclonae]SMA33198.1 hypothetical protein EHSB41UT_00240 [Parendozoicomonas haliclonae]